MIYMETLVIFHNLILTENLVKLHVLHLNMDWFLSNFLVVLLNKDQVEHLADPPKKLAFMERFSF